MSLEYAEVVRVSGTAICSVGFGLALWVGRRRPPPESAAEVDLPAAEQARATRWKLLAFAAMVVVPGVAMALANYHTFEGVHEVEGCGRCHVMRPMINDMRDPQSQTLAARHYAQGWIPKDQCYQCHSDYGLAGGLAAKAEGFRHLARYTTATYREPIVYRGHFRNDNCLKCHDGKAPFEGVRSHDTVRELLASSAMSCLNCHGSAHPTRAARTPGSPRYADLMRLPK